jgi:hypothetical protein
MECNMLNESHVVRGRLRLNSGRAAIAIVLVLAGAVLASCGGGETSSAPAAGPAPAPAPVPAPTLTLSGNPSSVASGSSATLSWSSTNATSCSASGSWSGAKASSGTASSGALTAASTFTLLCSGAGGSTSQSTTVNVTAAGSSGTVSGLNFPSNGTTSADVRFRFTGSNLQPMYPATYIWRVNLRHQPGYYTTFFWGPDGAFTGDSYYGAHPYPDGGGTTTTTHKWELSIRGTDVTSDANGNSTQLGYGVWRTQALRVWDDGVSGKVHEYYWDLPDTSKVIRVQVDRGYGTRAPANPALTFGDAPWSVGGERLSGILRGIQLYSSALSVNDILAEVNGPLSTNAGAASVWYLNLNPTPSDIADKSGKGHHPEWVSSGRPALWTGP